jgi:hypothetical protein
MSVLCVQMVQNVRESGHIGRNGRDGMDDLDVATDVATGWALGRLLLFVQGTSPE